MVREWEFCSFKTGIPGGLGGKSKWPRPTASI